MGIQVPDELLMKLRGLDVFGLTVPKQFGGLELMNTEILRLYEVLGRLAFLHCSYKVPLLEMKLCWRLY